MGLVLSCVSGCFASLACCFTQAACRCCCKGLPQMRYSTATRVGYAFVLVLGIVFSYLTRPNFVKNWLVNIPALCPFKNSTMNVTELVALSEYNKGFILYTEYFLNSSKLYRYKSASDSFLDVLLKKLTHQDVDVASEIFTGELLDQFSKVTPVEVCKAVVFQEATQRIWMSIAMFFLFMSLFTIDVRTSTDIRAYFNTGFWILKVGMIVALFVGFGYVRIDTPFSYAMFIIGMMATLLFLVIQLIIIVDFAHRWNTIWIQNADDSGNNIWYGAIAFFTFVMYAASLAMIACMFYFFAVPHGPKPHLSACHLEKFLVSFQLINCVLVSAVSILPKVQEYVPPSGLLQSSVVSVYSTFLLLTGMLNESSPCHSAQSVSTQLSTAFSIMSTVFSLVLIIYSAINNSDSEKARILGLQGGDDNRVDGLGGEDDKTNFLGTRHAQTVYDDEKEGVQYSYSLFHFFMFLASLYLMVLLTDWYNPRSPVVGDQVALWIKVVSCWTCMLIYLWTLAAPAIFTDRDFGY